MADNEVKVWAVTGVAGTETHLGECVPSVQKNGIQGTIGFHNRNSITGIGLLNKITLALAMTIPKFLFHIHLTT